MKAAELLRNEIASNMPCTKIEFIGVISHDIRTMGRSMFICDRHITKTSLCAQHTAHLKHEQILCEWAKEEGFNVSYEYNNYGVRKMIFII